MKIAAILAATVAVASLAACGVSAAGPAAHPPATPAPALTKQRAPARPSAKATSAPKPKASPAAKAHTAARMTAAQSATMNAWYSGATVNQAANVCLYVYRLSADDAAINSGTPSSRLQGDINALQDDVAKALANPPPVARDAAIWRRILNAYSNAAGDGTGSGLWAASRSASKAAWDWTPSFGGTLLVCLNPDI